MYKNINRLAVTAGLILLLGCSSETPKERFKQMAKESAAKVKELYPEPEWETKIELIDDELNVPPLQARIIHSTKFSQNKSSYSAVDKDLVERREVDISYTKTAYFNYEDGKWVYKKCDVREVEGKSTYLKPGSVFYLFAEMDGYKYLGVPFEEHLHNEKTLVRLWKSQK